MRSASILLCVSFWSAPGCADDDGDPDPGAADASPAADAEPDPEVDAAPSGGSAEISGTLHESSVNPTTAYLGDTALYEMIAMPEGGEDCSFEQREGGLIAMIGFPCGFAGTGTLAVTESIECGETATAWVLVEGFDGEFPEYLAESGSVIIATASDDLVTGTFTADFNEKDTLDGSFSAIVCGQRDGSRVSR